MMKWPRSSSNRELLSKTTPSLHIFRYCCLVMGTGFAVIGLVYSHATNNYNHPQPHEPSTTALTMTSNRLLRLPLVDKSDISSSDPLSLQQHQLTTTDSETLKSRKDDKVELRDSNHKQQRVDKHYVEELVLERPILAGKYNESSKLETNASAEDIRSATTLSNDVPASVPLYHVRLLRVPKAGSSSFSAFLRRQYGCVTEQHPAGDCTRNNRWYCLEIEGCSNHWPPPNWKSRTARSERVEPMITMIRDPVTRYISAFAYPGHHGKGLRGNITAHTILFPEYDNTQVNYLSRNQIGTWGNGQGKKNNKARTAPPDPAQLVTPQEMEARLQETLDLMNSEHLHFVGLVEHYHDSLRLFCRKYQCPNLEESLTETPIRMRRGISGYANDYDPQQDPAALQAIRQSNAFDYRLYHAAEARYCREVKRFQADEAFVASLTQGTRKLCGMEAGTGTVPAYHVPQQVIVTLR